MPAQGLPVLKSGSHFAPGARLYNHSAFQGQAQRAVLSKYLLALQLKFCKLD